MGSNCENGESSQTSRDAQFPFSRVCRVLEKVAACTKGKHRRKMELLQGLFAEYNDRANVYPLMRLILCDVDRERSTYGLKESKIADVYAKVLGLDKNSIDAVRLRNWKNPISGAGTAAKDVVVGDFASILYDVLRNRAPAHSPLTVAALNTTLDALNAASDPEEKRAVMMEIAKKHTAVEQKWIVKIIIKDLKIGVGHEAVLRQFHRDALMLWNVCNDLRKVCADLTDLSVRIPHQEVAVFESVSPQLAVAKNHWEAVVKAMNGRPFFIEFKYDGDRIMIHKRGSEVKYFTRNANDYTHILGPKFTAAVIELVRADCCIIDGEMLAWDTASESFEPFGSNRTVANINLPGDDGRQLCYMAFDILYIDGANVMGRPLSERRAALTRIVSPRPHVLDVVPLLPHHGSPDDVMHALDSAVAHRYEGIVVKNADSQYMPGERKHGGWVKLKPDYIDGMSDDLDLLILGAYYGNGRRGGDVSSFLMGVTEPELSSGPEPSAFLSFCRVGGGFTRADYAAIREQLAPYWKPYTRERAPPHWVDWVPAAGERPDVWIQPKQSLILQVRAFDIVKCSEKVFRAGYTLRFPRFMQIRPDKLWSECLSMPELMAIVRERRGRVSRKRAADLTLSLSQNQGPSQTQTQSAAAPDTVDADGDMDSSQLGASQPAPPRGRGRKKARSDSSTGTRSSGAVGRMGVMSQFQDTDTSHVHHESQLFQDLQFCVMCLASEQELKHELERKIVQFGGSKVQNPTADTSYIICPTPDPDRVMRVRNWIAGCQNGTNRKYKLPKCDVIRHQWVLDCIAARSLVPLKYRYIVYAAPETQKRLETEVDRFGDSFFDDCTVDTLSQALKKVSGAVESGDQVAALEDEDLDMLSITSNIFARHVVEVESRIPLSSLELARVQLELYGAEVVDAITPRVTHVVVDPRHCDRLPLLQHALTKIREEYRPLLRRYVVSAEWIDASIAAGHVVPELTYAPRDADGHDPDTPWTEAVRLFLQAQH